MDDILEVLQLGCSVNLDRRQAVRLGSYISNLKAERGDLAAKLATMEADILDREADLIITAPDESGMDWSSNARNHYTKIGAMMKARAAIARAKGGA